ncbi:NAD-dependent epimerase/dehydratase family protein [Methanosalsum natronophilum]|uniref:NAD-dependent epimerase/dehydratase family protein n=1 Tax=Methanosalsum natronophilum TaxID=768733 RepID=UPI0021684481|nr:NAD-dependent epimerase/dehydratase family protein [Methanosalsum natronophilum]MCS3924510.1 UDP-glucose 4-epimerase [Methanosalsum natronophilum]
MKNKRILITGGLGQVGSYLTERYYENNEITILDNASSSYRDTVPENVNLVIGDIQGPEAVRLVNQADIVIHTAAQIDVNKSFNQPSFDCDTNIQGTLNLLAASKDLNLDKFIYFSSAAVYGDPIKIPVHESHPTEPLSPYGVSKLAGEKYALMYQRAFDLPVVAIRPFNIYSPRQNPLNPYSGVISKFIEHVKSNQSPTIFGDGKQTRDFISVHDIVNLVNLILKSNKVIGKVFNAGTGTQTNINTLSDLVMELIGNELEINYQEARPGDIYHSVADISAAKKLGFKPDLNLKRGLTELI